MMSQDAGAIGGGLTGGSAQRALRERVLVRVGRTSVLPKLVRRLTHLAPGGVRVVIVFRTDGPSARRVVC